MIINSKKVAEFHKINCNKLQIYIKAVEDRHTQYIEPISDKQIQLLLKASRTPTIYFRLIEITSKFIRHKNYFEFLFHLFRKNQTDTEFFRKIHPFIKKQPIQTLDEARKSAAYMAARFACILEPLMTTNTNYLDFGCGNCVLTTELGKVLKIKNIYGTDIKTEFEENWDNLRQHNKELIFKYSDDNSKSIIPFDKKFDLITCFMVLHHVKDLDAVLTKIAAHLAPNGILLIKEHDCYDAADQVIADLTHSFFIMANESDFDIAIQKIQAQHIYYHDVYEWDYIMAAHNLTKIYTSNNILPGEKNVISAARNVVMVYKKNKTSF